MENDRNAKRVYVGEWASSRSVGRPGKRGIDTVKDCLKKRDLNVRQFWPIFYNKNVGTNGPRGQP